MGSRHIYRSEDQQSLTVLLTLSDGASFEGGGTAFWSSHDVIEHRSCRSDGRTLVPPTPSVVVRPPAGTAIVFCGEVTHAALTVTEGERCMFVASFSLSSVLPARG